MSTENLMATDQESRWRAIDIGGAFFMESTDRNEQITGAHCVACAYTDVITRHGGDVDLRGLFRYGPCYQFLAVLVKQERDARKGKGDNSELTEVLLGHGILDWAKAERKNDRYGTVLLFPKSYDDEPLRFDSTLAGKHGALSAVVCETRDSDHCGEPLRNLYPQTPTVGDRLEMGRGKLFFEEENSFVGVKPPGRRKVDWMDPRVLYRLHSQTVDLYFIPNIQLPPQPDEGT